MDLSELAKLPWVIGCFIATGVLFWLALRLPVQTRLSGVAARFYGVGVIIAVIAILALANAALSLYDIHFDMTREKKYTPSKAALDVVARLKHPVKLTYLYQSDDESGRQTRDIVELMGRRNPLLQVKTADPHKQPGLARSLGVKSYNAAVLEAGGRRIIVNTVDESEIAIGIQRVLRQRAVTVCFMEGHGEYPANNYEFHTHVEGLAGHEHDQGASAVIQTSAHGIGRLRRALESIGYDVRTVITATKGSIPAECVVVINARPQTTYLPTESRILEKYLQRGGSLLAMYDLGFVLEAGLETLMGKLGVHLPQAVVIDPKSHYATDPEMVAVTGYDKHPITRTASFTFYPGVRPLELRQPIVGVRTVPLIVSSTASYSKAVAPVAQRQVQTSPGPLSKVESARQSHTLAAAIDGTLPGTGSRPFRVVVIGDGDFASNSFFPFMSNNDLALAMVRWLAREEKKTSISARVRVPPLILLTKTQMQSLFIFIEILLPLSVVLLGGLAWWRRR